MTVHFDGKDMHVTSQGLWGRILICMLLLLGIGVLNSLWRNLDYLSWYNSLSKPTFYPRPRWIVGAIWTVMYLLISVVLGRIWQMAAKTDNERIKKHARYGIRIFILQILINMAVPLFFFGLNNLLWVLLSVVLNLAVVIVMIFDYKKLNHRTSYLLIPYAVWLTYALLLDVSFVWLN